MQNDFRSRYLPYCLEQTKSGKWVVLNRYYKPLGMANVPEHVDYEPFTVRIPHFDKRRQAAVSWEALPGDRVWLYNDATIPTKSVANMKVYLKHLFAFAKLKFEEA